MSQPDCLGVCDIDWEAGLCLSCGRSTDEIAGDADSGGPPPERDPAADGDEQ